MKNVIVLIFSVLMLSSCEEKLVEKVKSSHPNEVPSYVEYYKTVDSTEILVKYVRYYFNGEKQEESFVSNNKKNGRSTLWHMNGEKMYECNYKDNVYDGSFVQWYEDGTIEYEAEYKLGAPVGVWKFYNKDGSLQSEKKFD